MSTVADHVISALRISGVRRVYGLPGDSFNAAQAVTILGGAGVEGAHDEVIQAAATLYAPVVHAG